MHDIYIYIQRERGFAIYVGQNKRWDQPMSLAYRSFDDVSWHGEERGSVVVEKRKNREDTRR